MSLGIEGFDLGFNSNSSNWQSHYRNVCSNESFEGEQRNLIHEYTKTVSSALADVLKLCVAKKGLHAWLETASSPGRFWLHMKYSPDQKNSPTPVIEAFRVLGAVCYGDMKVGSKVDVDGVSLLCERNPSDPVDILIDASAAIINDTPLSLSDYREVAPPIKNCAVYSNDGRQCLACTIDVDRRDIKHKDIEGACFQMPEEKEIEVRFDGAYWATNRGQGSDCWFGAHVKGADGDYGDIEWSYNDQDCSESKDIRSGFKRPANPDVVAAAVRIAHCQWGAEGETTKCDIKGKLWIYTRAGEPK